MNEGRPDPERRLVPRWRASREAVNAGELRSSRPKIPIPTDALDVPQFEALRLEWEQDSSVELAGDLISCGVTLGRTSEKEVREAAELVLRTNLPEQLQSVARRALSGTLGMITDPAPIAFDPELARAELQARIASHKRRVRIYPKNALAWTDLARLYTALGQQAKAREAIQVATSLAPGNRFVLRSAARFLVHADGKHREERIDEGLRFLRSADLLRDDPWVMAAEISLSTIVGKEPRSLKWARNIAKHDTIDPWDSSELHGALATLALQQGGIGNPRKLFNRSLRIPTENALAQAQWASDTHKIVAVPEILFEAMEFPAHEALALRYRAERRWRESIQACRAWSAMDPTSTRPLFLGGFIAEVAMEDGTIALEFFERALLIEPGSALAHNNLAVALAYLGRVADAEEQASKSRLYEMTDGMDAVCMATQGLLAYRRGNRRLGSEFYLRAAQTPGAKSDSGLLAMVLWHLLREEARLHVPGTEVIAEHLWKVSASMKVPEIEAIHQRINSDMIIKDYGSAKDEAGLDKSDSMTPFVMQYVDDLSRRS